MSLLSTPGPMWSTPLFQVFLCEAVKSRHGKGISILKGSRGFNHVKAGGGGAAAVAAAAAGAVATAAAEAAVTPRH